MAFLSSIFQPEHPPSLTRGSVKLRLPRLDDFEEWAALRRSSRKFLEPWEPLWGEDDLTSYAFRQRIRSYGLQAKRDAGYPFFIFHRTGGQLIGAITLSHVRRGVAQMCSMGYWIGEDYARQGHMTDAVEAAVTHGFTDLGLHRVEAACLPSNAASVALLKRCGFKLEGLASDYLKIAGLWQDHLLFSRIAP